MTLTLDNTVGGANANAYCSIAEADAYHEARGFNDRWVTGSVTEKTAAIVWATRLLDMENFVGTMTVRTGALRWPRFGIIDRDYRIVDPQVIPQFIKNAVAEWAFFLLSEDRTRADGLSAAKPSGSPAPPAHPQTIRCGRVQRLRYEHRTAAESGSPAKPFFPPEKCHFPREKRHIPSTFSQHPQIKLSHLQLLTQG